MGITDNASFTEPTIQLITFFLGGGGYERLILVTVLQTDIKRKRAQIVKLKIYLVKRI